MCSCCFRKGLKISWSPKGKLCLWSASHNLKRQRYLNENNIQVFSRERERVKSETFCKVSVECCASVYYTWANLFPHWDKRSPVSNSPVWSQSSPGCSAAQSAWFTADGVQTHRAVQNLKSCWLTQVKRTMSSFVSDDEVFSVTDVTDPSSAETLPHPRTCQECLPVTPCSQSQDPFFLHDMSLPQSQKIPCFI